MELPRNNKYRLRAIGLFDVGPAAKANAVAYDRILVSVSGKHHPHVDETELLFVLLSLAPKRAR